MLRQAYAFFPASTNLAGTLSRAVIASRRAARSASSPLKATRKSSSSASSGICFTTPDLGRDLTLV